MRKYILTISILGSLIITSAFLGLLSPFYEFEYLELIFNVSLFFPFILLFSLITYFAPERVFAAWWKFAKFAIPVIFVLLLIVNLGLLHGKNDAWPALIDIPALIFLYSVFTLGSIWQIWKGWRSA